MPTCREVPACRAPPRERALAPALVTARAAAHADPAHTTAADSPCRGLQVLSADRNFLKEAKKATGHKKKEHNDFGKVLWLGSDT